MQYPVNAHKQTNRVKRSLKKHDVRMRRVTAKQYILFVWFSSDAINSCLLTAPGAGQGERR